MRKIVYSLIFSLTLIILAGTIPEKVTAQTTYQPPRDSCIYARGIVGRIAPGGDRQMYTCVCSSPGKDGTRACSWIANYTPPSNLSSGKDACAGLMDKLSPTCWWNTIKQGIATMLITLGGMILYLAGVVLNFAFKYTIVEMSSFISGMTSIGVVWSTFRDLANLLFIFVLIYIAVQMILGIDKGAKNLLVSVIVGAMFINFSLFFTKIIIDASNTLAFQFYTAIEASPQNRAALYTPDVGISWAFMRPMMINTFFKVESGFSSSSGLQNVGASASAIDLDTSKEVVFVSVFMAFVFMLIAAFVFLTIAILLVIRFTVLILLMVTSPIYVVGMLLPQAAGISKKWQSQLIDQCLFAPALMIGLWFVYKIVNDDMFIRQMAGVGFAEAFQGGDAQNLVVFLNFFIVITLLIIVLVVAKNLGGSGASFASKWAGKLSFGVAGATGRWALGNKVFGRLEKSLKDTAFARTEIGRSTLGGLKYVANSSFDVRSAGVGALAQTVGVNLGTPGKGFYDVLKTKTKTREDYSKDLGDKPVFHNEEAEKRHKKLGEAEKEQEKRLKELLESNAKIIKESGKLSKDQQDAFNESRKQINKEISRIKGQKFILEQAHASKPQEIYALNLETSFPITWYDKQADKAAVEKIRKSLKQNDDQKLLNMIKKAAKGTGEEGGGGEEKPKPEKPTGGGDAPKKEEGDH